MHICKKSSIFALDLRKRMKHRVAYYLALCLFSLGLVDAYADNSDVAITDLTLSSSRQAPNEPVTATPTITPTPTGSIMVCWKILRSNGDLYSDTGFTKSSGNTVSFNAPSATGTYQIACVLREGNTCEGGSILDSVVTNLIVTTATVSLGDYRIYYSDNATWSNGAHTRDIWHHPSRAINKENSAIDTISLYIAQGADISNTLKFQYVSNIDAQDLATWTDVTDGAIDLSDYSSVITQAGVYNFITQQTSDAISITKVEPYTGNYYIAPDIEMTNIDFDPSTDPYSHYYVQALSPQDISFFIANDYSPSLSDTLVGSLLVDANIRFMYNEYSNRLTTAYIPADTDLSDIQTDLILVRNHQEPGQLLISTDTETFNPQTAYGLMRFDRTTLNNSDLSLAERSLYWISLPFDVSLSDVYGFGTYSKDWIIMTYNGAERAAQGFWKDSEGFWDEISDPTDIILEAGKGYVLALEIDSMQSHDNYELFFPSTDNFSSVQQTSIDIDVPAHECTIDRRSDKTVNDWNKDRRIADSHWNIIGIPTYSNPNTLSLSYLYEWNAADNTYTVQSGTDYPYQTMHAYYVQYQGTIHWTLDDTPSPVVARRTYAEAPHHIEFRLELRQNNQKVDQTFITFSDDENASANFAFGEDLNKEFNDSKSNIYTFIESYIPSAGNTLPMTNQTTIIPIGLTISETDDYTFSLPEDTKGVGFTLIDSILNTRTYLSAGFNYTLPLAQGEYNNRFYIEISPVQNTTSIEHTQSHPMDSHSRKIFIDGQLYIIRDNRLYDITGKGL